MEKWGPKTLLGWFLEEVTRGVVGGRQISHAKTQVVREIARLHGAKLFVKSTKGATRAELMRFHSCVLGF